MILILLEMMPHPRTEKGNTCTLTYSSGVMVRTCWLHFFRQRPLLACYLYTMYFFSLCNKPISATSEGRTVSSEPQPT